MIIDQDGRHRSIRTLDEQRKRLEEMVLALSPEEQQIFWGLYEEAENGNLLHHQQAQKIDFETPPVDVETFLRDDYFLGESGKNLYPLLMDDMIELFEGEYSEAILTGSLALDSIIQEADGGLPTLAERIGHDGDVLTLMDRDGLQRSTTELAHVSGIKRVVRLILANGMKLDLTPDHKVRVYDDGYKWVAAEELGLADLVVVPRWIRTEPSMNLGDDEAMLLGYQVGDGRRYDSDALTHDVIVPEAVCKSTNRAVALFLNRLWSCEGTVYAPEDGESPPRFNLAMTSERFVRQVQLLLLRFGIRSRLHKVLHKNKRRTGKVSVCWHLVVSGVAQLRRFLDSIGVIYAKEAACERISAYCRVEKSNTNVDTLPITWGWLNDAMIRDGIKRDVGNHCWKLGTARNRRLSREMFKKWLVDYEDTTLGDRLLHEFPGDLAFEPVKSIESILVQVPTGDIGAHQGNRFIANGISVHNSLGWGKCVDGDTEVYDVSRDRSRTVKEIADSAEWIEVPSFFETQQIIKSSRARAFFSGVKKCVRLELVDGHWVILSIDHPVFTNRGWVEAADLTLMDLVATGEKSVKTRSDISAISWKRIAEIEHVGEREVYDLSVPGPRSFVGNSIVLHNTYFSSLATLYIIYQISCLRHPQTIYGIDEGSYIALSMISVNEKTARRAVFSELVAKLERSPYFQEQFPYKRYWIEVRFTRKPVMIVAGSTQSNAILSLNIFGGIVDEANFMGQVKTVRRHGSQVRFTGTDRAEVIYNAIIRRMKSRFMRSGKLPGILFLPSSKDVVSSFTEQRINQSREDPTIFVRDYNTWMIKRKHFINSPTFKVLVGNERINSRILEPGEEVEYEDIEGVKIIDIPEDYRPDFERNLEDAIREIAGESIFGVSLFFQRLDKIEEMCQAGDKAGLMHPYSVYEWQTDKPGEFTWDRICKRVTRRLPGGYTEEAWEPIRNPEAPRHVRLDPSLTGDCTGVAVGHVAGWSEVVRRDDKGQEYNELAPHMIVDFILRVVPPVGDEILLGDIRSLIYQLMEHGFNIRFASSDQFQSADTKQKFIQRGIAAKISSTDKDKQMFQTLKVAIYEGRVLCYTYPILVEELKRLEYDPIKGKVDHPRDGCFVGETRIPLLDGTIPMMQELVDREVGLYSSMDDGTIVPGRGKARITKYVTELVDVVLDGGAVERCTPEHLWRLRDGSYKEARYLRPGTDRLMPIRRSWSVNGEPGLTHEVREIIPVSLDKSVPVYDIEEVTGRSNFALASGVFVHNSKDVADALAGLVYHLTTEETPAPIPPTMGKQSFPDEKDDSWVTEGWKPVKTEKSGATQQVDGVDVPMPPLPFVKR